MSMLVRKGTMLHRTRSPRRYSRRCSTVRGRERAKSLAVASTNRSNTPHGRPCRSSLQSTSFSPSTTEIESRRSSNTTSQISMDDSKYLHDDIETGNFDTSLIYQMRDANFEASNCFEFVSNALHILNATTFATVVAVIVCILPLLMIIFGVKYIRDCPREPCVPIYLLVGGFFGLLRCCLLLWRQNHSRRHYDVHYEMSLLLGQSHNEAEAAILCARIMETILTLFLIGWFAAGNYWTLTIYMPKFEPPRLAPNDWCDPNLYQFALAQILITYILTTILFLLILCLIFGRCVTACGIFFKT